MHDQRIQLGRPAAARASHGRNAERNIRPVLSRGLGDFGAAHQFEHGPAVLRAGVETGVIERRPARGTHGIGHPQRRLGRGGSGKIDPHLELAGWLDRAIGFQPGDLAIDVALLAFRVANGGVRGSYFLRNRGKGRAPIGDRTGLTLLTNSRRGGFGKTLGEFATRGGSRNRALQVGALVLQRLDALVEFGQIDRRCCAGRPGIDRPNGKPGTGLALHPQRGGIER